MILKEVGLLIGPNASLQRLVMKVRASIKKMCDKCRIIKRYGVLRVICAVKKHKQRQG